MSEQIDIFGNAVKIKPKIDKEKRNLGMSFEKLSKEYGVCKKTIMRAVSGQNWSTVDVPEAPKMKGGAE